MTNGEKIKVWREANGFSREEVAVKLKKSLSTVVGLEHGKSTDPMTLLRLARIMACPMEELLLEDDHQRAS